MYNISFDDLPKQLIPGVLRKSKMLAFLQVCLTGPKQLLADFITYRAAKLKEVSYNSQTIMMEKYLNDTYPDANGQIYITNVNSPFNTTSLYREVDQIAVDFYKESESTAVDFKRLQDVNPYDFIVHVPSALDYDLNQLNSYIEKYKLASKRYIIEEF